MSRTDEALDPRYRDSDEVHLLDYTTFADDGRVGLTKVAHCMERDPVSITKSREQVTCEACLEESA